MQPPYSQQAYGQYPPTPSHNSGPGYYPTVPTHPGVTDFMTPVFAQRTLPYSAQPYTTQDIYSLRGQSAIRAGPGYRNGVYGGGPIPDYGSYHAMAESWGTPAPQPLQNGGYSVYSMPGTIPQSNISEPYYAGHHFRTSFSPRLPEADPNQNVASEWRIHPCCVYHAEEDSIHPSYGNEAYGGGSVSGYGPSHAIAGPGSWGTPAVPQNLQNSIYSLDYSVPRNIPYGSLGQGSDPYVYHSGTEEVPGPSTRTSFSPPLPEADLNQNAPSEWGFRNCCQPYGGR